MLAAGISREEAARLVERHPQAISIAAVNGLARHPFRRCSGARRNRQSLNEAAGFSRILQVDVPFHSPKMEQLKNELIECLRDIQPAAGIDAILLHGDRHCSAWGLKSMGNIGTRISGSRCCSTTPWEKVIDAGHRVFLEIGAHPILRRDIVACLKEKSLAGTTVGSFRRDQPERATLLGSLGRLLLRSAPKSIGGSFFQPMRRGSSCRLIRSRRDSHWREADQIGGCAVVRRFIHCWEPDMRGAAVLECKAGHGRSGLFGGPSDRHLDRFSGRGHMSRWPSRQPGRLSGSVPCVLEDIEFEKFLALDEKEACSAQVVFDPDSSSPGSMPVPMLRGTFGNCMRADASGNPADPRRSASISHKLRALSRSD